MQVPLLPALFSFSFPARKVRRNNLHFPAPSSAQTPPHSALPLFSPVKIRYNKISNFYVGFLMNHTRSQLLLFGYGFVGIFSLPVDAAFVLAALTAVIISCLNSFLTDARIQTGLLLLYGLISFWCPPFFLFLSGRLLWIFYNQKVLFRLFATFLFPDPRLFYASGKYIFSTSVWFCLQLSAFSNG